MKSSKWLLCLFILVSSSACAVNLLRRDEQLDQNNRGQFHRFALQCDSPDFENNFNEMRRFLADVNPVIQADIRGKMPSDIALEKSLDAKDLQDQYFKHAAPWFSFFLVWEQSRIFCNCRKAHELLWQFEKSRYDRS